MYRVNTNNRRVIAKLYERDMDLVIIEELQSSSEFRCWLAARVFGVDCYHSFDRAEHSVTDDTQRESDVIYLFWAKSGEASDQGALTAILIENKIDAVAQPNQGMDYQIRGKAGKDREEWSDFKTCLIAPKSYLQQSQDKVHYNENVSYEELLAYFASRKERDERFRWKTKLIGDAIIKKESKYAPDINEEATAFVLKYYGAASAFPLLQMREPKPRPVGNTWISFRPEILSKGVWIEHQTSAGAVKLLIPNAAERIDDFRMALQPLLTDRMTVELAGKSVAVSIRVPRIPSITVPFENVAEEAQQAIRAADALRVLVEQAASAGIRVA